MSGPPPPPPPFPAGFQPPSMMPPLPPGWTEHRAPAGQPYWFHPVTNVSTYVRPLHPPGMYPAPPPPPPHQLPPLHFGTPAPAIIESSGGDKEGKKEKREKPKTKTPIAGTDWVKVVTNKGNVFWNHAVTKASVWTVPDEIKSVVEEMERAERGEGALKRDRDEQEEEGAEQDKDEPVDEMDTVESKDEPKGDVVKADDPEEPPKKKKRQKNRVIHDLAELKVSDLIKSPVENKAAGESKNDEAKNGMEENGEDAAGDGEAPTKEPEEEKPLEPSPPPAPAAPVVHDAFIPPPRGEPQQARIDVSAEEGIALFKAMLGEKDINAMAPWDMELPKFVNDPRYLAVKQLKDRRDLFDEFCKVKIREQRAAKKAALEAGGPKQDPLAAYRSLLQSAVTSTRTHFSDFKRTHNKDPRFREFGKTEGEREKVFKTWLRELGERKRAEAGKAEERFREMLREDSAIKEGDKWSEVKLRHVQDPRYDAVNSSSLRESLFTQHLSALSGPSASASKEDRAARAAASLREREAQVRREKALVDRNANAARGAAGREEGEREFNALLIDTVRDHEARWDVVAPAIEGDPRSALSPLSLAEKRRLFDQHLTEVYQKRVAALEALFLSHSPQLNTLFDDVLPHVEDTPQAHRLVGQPSSSSVERLKGLFEAWRRRRESTARAEFDELLRESPIIDHWGRLQKEAEAKKTGDGGATLDVPDEEEEEPDDVVDIGVMAGQIDLKAIQAVLKHDKRYLIFNHEPEQRTQWIKDYLAKLEAPKLTAHQRR